MSTAVVTTCTALGAFTAAMAYGALWPRCRWLAPGLIHHGPRTGPPRIALTFDDGPDPHATTVIGDTLAELGVHGCFFVIGAHARAHPGVLRRLDAQGHLIANHTDTHSYLGMWRGIGYWRRELRRAGDAVERAIGKRPALFRPPMGFKQGLMAIAVKQEKLTMVTWSRRGRDGWPTTTDRILARLAGPARRGDVLTLHDGHDPHLTRDPTPTVNAVAPLVAALRGRGLEPVRLDELLGRAGYLDKQGPRGGERLKAEV